MAQVCPCVIENRILRTRVCACYGRLRDLVEQRTHRGLNLIWPFRMDNIYTVFSIGQWRRQMEAFDGVTWLSCKNRLICFVFFVGCFVSAYLCTHTHTHLWSRVVRFVCVCTTECFSSISFVGRLHSTKVHPIGRRPFTYFTSSSLFLSTQLIVLLLSRYAYTRRCTHTHTLIHTLLSS